MQNRGEMGKNINPLRLVIIGGFLGSGKTTLLKRIIDWEAKNGNHPAVIMSEFGELDVDGILKAMEARYQNEQLTTIDGVKIDFAESWVHLRKSNTEPIIRIYTEAKSQNEADALANKIIGEIKGIAGL